MCIYFLLVSIFYVLHVSPVKIRAFNFYVPYLFIFYINVISSVIFRFSNKEDEQILRLRLTIKINVRFMATLTCRERLTELRRSCQQMLLFSGFFFMSQLGGFSINQIKLIYCVQCFYNIDVETELQQPYCSQLWQVDCHYFTIYFRRF